MKTYSAFYLVIIVSIFFQQFCCGQSSDALRHQLNFTCDNNFFLFNGDDGYYTSGLFLRYDRLSPKEMPSTTKRIYSYEIGQMIFTAHSREILLNSNPLGIPYGLNQIDRPIAGYLYAKASRISFYHDRKMVALGVSVGMVGDNSFGRQTQESWHGLIGVKNYWNWVWDYQVKNEVGVNLHGSYAQSLLKSDQLSFVQITPVTEATLGTTFTNLSQSLVLQLGKLRPISSSSYWNSRLQLTGTPKGRQAIEFFVYYRPTVKYQLYNATIQGGFFRSDKGPILSEPKPIVFAHEVGVRLSMSRYCLGYKVAFQSKESQGQFNRQSYASFTMTYRF